MTTKELTLEQVRRAERPAMGMAEADGVKIILRWDQGDRITTFPTASLLAAEQRGSIPALAVPETGWHHVADCGCEFCLDLAR